MNNCIFCKIANKEVPSEIVYETDKVIAFKDLNPVADTHILIIPKEHHEDFLALANGDSAGELSQALMQAVKEISDMLDIKSFHLLNNCGKEHGQSVFHVHIHLISGVNLTQKLFK